MKVEFVTAGQPIMAASRIRGWDLVAEWNDPNVTCHFVRQWFPDKPDVIVLQKVFRDVGTREQPDSPKRLEMAFETGARLFWDLADPIWYWMKEDEFRRIADKVEAIVVSSLGLKEQLKLDMGYDSFFIDDRFPTPPLEKVYTPNEPPMLVWFGYGRNRTVSLHNISLALCRLAVNKIPFELTVIDNMEKEFVDDRLLHLAGLGYANYVQWDRTTIWTELCDCDIAILPPPDSLVGRMKSTNKTTMAKWAGLPVTGGQNYEELRKLLTDSTFRQSEGLKNRRWAEENGHVSKSIEEWKTVIGYN